MQIAEARVEDLRRQLQTARSALLVLRAIDDASRSAAQAYDEPRRLVYRPKAGTGA